MTPDEWLNALGMVIGAGLALAGTALWFWWSDRR